MTDKTLREAAADHPALHRDYPSEPLAALHDAFMALPACPLLSVVGAAMQEIQSLRAALALPDEPVAMAPAPMLTNAAISHCINQSGDVGKSEQLRYLARKVEQQCAYAWGFKGAA